MTTSDLISKPRDDFDNYFYHDLTELISDPPQSPIDDLYDDFLQARRDADMWRARYEMLCHKLGLLIMEAP